MLFQKNTVFIWQCITYAVIGVSLLIMAIIFICLDRRARFCQDEYGYLDEAPSESEAAEPQNPDDNKTVSPQPAENNETSD